MAGPLASHSPVYYSAHSYVAGANTEENVRHLGNRAKADTFNSCTSLEIPGLLLDCESVGCTLNPYHS